MLEIYTLGQISLRRDQQPLTDFISQKAEVLFIYLLMNPRLHQREVLASTFWGDTSTEQAMKNLRTALASLQKQLAPELSADRQTIGIEPEAHIWLDVRVFEQQLAQYGSADFVRYKPPRSVLRSLTKTVDLYTGDFLPGFHAENAPELDNWVNLERERLRQRAINALGMLIDYLTDWGDYQAGMTYAYRLLNLDPLSEIGIRRLLRLLAYTGDRNNAVRQFNLFKQNLAEKLEVDPEPETFALFEQVKSGRLRPAKAITPTANIPDPGGVFIERPQEMAQITQHLDAPEARLVTLVGVGGVGKTRLALYTALARRDEYQHGVHYVPLASVQSPDLVAPQMLAALPIDRMQGNAATQLKDYLRDKHMLLLLDNFEQVVEASPLINEILLTAPNVKILATSREPLGLRSEYIIRLEGLTLPPLADDGSFTADEAQTCSAVRLFSQVAQRVQPGFQTELQLDTVVRICYLVDGLPLGIEIAAAHVTVIPLDQIETHLDSLQNVHRDVPQRHSGIRYLLQDIWKLLSEEERQVMRRFAVFTGDFDLAAALAIGQTDPNTITRLVNKSLLQKRGERYDLHQIIWRYLVEQLEAARDSENANAAYIAYYRQWVEALDACHLKAHEHFKVMDTEYHNLWAALQSTSGSDQLFFAVALGEYWTTRGFNIQEGADLLRRLTALPDPDHNLYIRGLLRLGALLFNLTEYSEARTVLEKCLAEGVEAYPRVHALTLNTLTQICTRTGEEEQAHEYAEMIRQVYEAAPDKDSHEMQLTHLLAHSILGYVSVEIGNYPAARHHCLIAAELAQELGELRDLASILNNLGLIHQEEDKFEQAYTYYSRALDIAREVEHKSYIMIFTNNLGSAAVSLDKYDEAFLLTLEAGIMAQQSSFNALLVYVINNFVTINKGLGRVKYAVMLQGAEDRLRESLGMPVVMRNRDFQANRYQAFIDQLGEAEFQNAYAAGQMLSAAQAIEFAQQVYFNP